MTFSPEHLESLTTKEDVIEYATSFGVDGLSKKRKLETLKRHVLETLAPACEPVPRFCSLIEKLEEETHKGMKEELTPVANGENVTVKLKGEVIATMPIPALETWCIANSIDFQVVKGMVGLPFLHHNHYTFHKS